MTTTPHRDPRRRTPLKTVALATLALALAVSGCASSRAMRDAEREEAREHWDLAVLAWEHALAMEPTSTNVRIAVQRAKMKAAQVHYERGRIHHSAGQLDLAAAELEQAIALDPTLDAAQQEMRRVKADIAARAAENAGGTAVEKAKARTRGMRGAPPMLEPSSTKPIDVTFPPDTSIKKIYAALGAAAGINVIFDPQLKDDRFTLDLRGMTFQKALETAMRQAGHFYKVIDEHTILIAQDTQQNRKEYEDLVIRTFFLSNGDVKDVSQMVRSILDLRRLAVIPQLNAIVIRDTADKVAVAERLIDENDKAKAEVVVDVELLQINTEQLIDLGARYQPASVTATVVPGAAGGATTAATSLPWNALKSARDQRLHVLGPVRHVQLHQGQHGRRAPREAAAAHRRGGEGPARHRRPRPDPRHDDQHAAGRRRDGRHSRSPRSSTRTSASRSTWSRASTTTRRSRSSSRSRSRS